MARLRLLMLPLFVSVSASALAADWDGDTSTDWDDANNWVGGTTPTDGSDININHVEADPPFSPVITSTTTNTSLPNSFIYIGYSGGSDASLTINGGGLLQTYYSNIGDLPTASVPSRFPEWDRLGRPPSP